MPRTLPRPSRPRARAHELLLSWSNPPSFRRLGSARITAGKPCAKGKVPACSAMAGIHRPANAWLVPAWLLGHLGAAGTLTHFSDFPEQMMCARVARHRSERPHSGDRGSVTGQSRHQEGDLRLQGCRWEAGDQHAKVYDQGVAVAVLPFDPARGTVLLTRQFRLPAWLNGYRERLIEACAGRLDGEEPRRAFCARPKRSLGIGSMTCARFLISSAALAF